MTDWLEHDGGPQPVANDVWVERPNSSRRIGPAHWFDWTVKGQFLILNQHLIDAARLLELEPEAVVPLARQRLAQINDAEVNRTFTLNEDTAR